MIFQSSLDDQTRPNPGLTLASSSPRRHQLLALGGWGFNIVQVNVDETPFPAEDPRAYVLRMAEEKAHAAVFLPEAGDIIIGADTTVVDGPAGSNDTILGKPLDEEDAWKMLRRLRGRTHYVYTGIAVIRKKDGLVLTDICSTPVPMRHYTDEEIAAYIASGDPMDKAGGYAIQNAGFHPVEYLNGCYANVVGLPLCHLARALAGMGILPLRRIAPGCQEMLGYHCTFFPSILGELA